MLLTEEAVTGSFGGHPLGQQLQDPGERDPSLQGLPGGNMHDVNRNPEHFGNSNRAVRGFTFDGRPVTARTGQTLAAALTEAGLRSFRETAKGGTRGIFCGMGVCQDCLVTVDGQPNLRACMTKAADGLSVATQPAFPRLDPEAAAKKVQAAMLVCTSSPLKPRRVFDNPE